MKPLILIGLMTATPAWAQCPVGADLQNGIRVTEDDGTTHVYTPLRNGIIQVESSYPDDYVTRNLLAQGNHVLQLANLDDGVLIPDSILNVAYPSDVSTLPVPAANTVWITNTVVRGYGDIYKEVQTHTWGEPFDLTIGACSYQTLPGELNYVNDTSTIEEGVYFLIDLGFSLLYSYDDTEGDLDVYTFVDIEAVQ